jgi:hypothetical protein
MLVLLVVDVGTTHACSCVGDQSFLEVVRETPIAVVGRVTAVGERRYLGPVSMELEVEWIAKGSVTSRAIRVWDSGASSDCASLTDAKVGRSFAIAISPVTREDDEDHWRLLELERRPRPGEYVVSASACSTPVLWLRSDRQRKSWLGRRLG